MLRRTLTRSDECSRLSDCQFSVEGSPPPRGFACCAGSRWSFVRSALGRICAGLTSESEAALLSSLRRRLASDSWLSVSGSAACSSPQFALCYTCFLNIIGCGHAGTRSRRGPPKGLQQALTCAELRLARSPSAPPLCSAANADASLAVSCSRSRS